MNNTQRKHYVDGFPSLANFIASDRDGTSTIFKRFNRLAARNLLNLQSELAELEAKLDAFDDQDRESRESLQSLRNWKDFKTRNGEDSERRKLLRDIKSTLKEYSMVIHCYVTWADPLQGEALMFESTLATIPPPDRKTLKAFRTNFFHGRPGETGAFPMLGGHSASLYDESDDLLVLHSREPPDRLTMFVQDNFGYLFEESGPANGSSIAYASGKKISTFISYISTVLAAVLLIGAIVILYNINSDNLKLGLIALFTVLFSASVGLLTNAKRAEVFGATAAYAAVLVVFVSGDLGS
ncbi:hypothetical protein FPSE_08069 [Fusarium pseudograminearum CS3096]|uniref:DUF6594 domain-containing protein n=1 Tax=Fusarium pseudograminearum (strain CS3096) TaxID=1028729 RepID=K3UIW6_FUSPC|nr:hypothetical protein FPSE_08069 [Fusarium pseudograminearum CS3096]EKJ71801.1 hypothetical protein FPSE_08069 [Fusarium pseudograminearum CS3096]